MLRRQLYRSLLRQAKKIDRNPRIKAFIFTSDATFPREGYENVRIEHVLNDKTADKAMKQLVQDFCAPGLFYKPQKSLSQLVQKTFREPPSDLNENQLHQLGFLALRQLINCEAIAKELVVYNEIPHGLKSTIAVPASEPTATSTTTEISLAEEALKPVELFSGSVTTTPEVGSILVSHPLRTEEQFSCTVMLVTHITDDHSRGIVLNRDFTSNFKDLLTKAERVKYGADLKHFYEMPCFDGGNERFDDYALNFALLHQQDSLAPYSERIQLSSPSTVHDNASSMTSVVKDYMYISHDFHAIGKEIVAGRIKTEDLKIVRGCTDWIERELQEHVTQHRFFSIHCPVYAGRIVMQSPVPDSFGNPVHAKLWYDPTVWYSGQYAWSKLLHLLGGEYRDMARLMRIASSEHAELLFAILPTLPGFDYKIVEKEEGFEDYDSGDDEQEVVDFLASALRLHPAVFSEAVTEAIIAAEFEEPDDDEDED